jgi:hypothetical protein
MKLRKSSGLPSSPIPRITIDTAGMNPKATELANQLALKIGGLSDASLEGLLHQLRVAAVKDDI